MDEKITYIPLEEKKEPKRGDVFYANFDSFEKTVGSEQNGRRPVIVIQNDKGNKFSPTVIIAILTTKSKRNLPTHVAINNFDILSKESTACLEQIKTVDKTRLETFQGTVDESTMKNIDKAIAISFGIDKDFFEAKERQVDSVHTADNYAEELNLEAKETIFDGKDTDWLDLVEKQYDFFKNLQQYLVNLKIKKREIEIDIENILSEMENDTLNAAKGYKTYKTLREQRIIRRDICIEIEKLKTIIETMDCETITGLYGDTVSKITKLEDPKEQEKIIKGLIDTAM